MKGGPPELVWDPQDADFGCQAVDDMNPHRPEFLPLIFGAGGTSLITLLGWRDTVQAGQYDLPTGQARDLTEGSRVIYALSANRDGTRLALLQTDMATPGDLYSGEHQNGSLTLRRPAEPNRAILDEVALHRPQSCARVMVFKKLGPTTRQAAQHLIGKYESSCSMSRVGCHCSPAILLSKVLTTGVSDRPGT